MTRSFLLAVNGRSYHSGASGLSVEWRMMTGKGAFSATFTVTKPVPDT